MIDADETEGEMNMIGTEDVIEMIMTGTEEDIGITIEDNRVMINLQ